MEYHDIEKKCKEQDCGKAFIVTAGEQDFFARKGLSVPARCPDCRQKRKNRENSPFKPLLDNMGGGHARNFPKDRREGRDRKNRDRDMLGE